MARLLILRHGKAENFADSGHDKDRRLVRRGEENAKYMGKQIKDHMKKPDLVLVSSATRTQETASFVMKALGDIPVVTEDRIYNADGETLWDIITDYAHDDKTVLIIGHNPGLIILMYMLMDDDGMRGQNNISDFPTCSLAELVFDANKIGDIKQKTGTLLSLLRPRDLGIK